MFLKQNWNLYVVATRFRPTSFPCGYGRGSCRRVACGMAPVCPWQAPTLL